jgi:hypothetical protein
MTLAPRLPEEFFFQLVREDVAGEPQRPSADRAPRAVGDRDVDAERQERHQRCRRQWL